MKKKTILSSASLLLIALLASCGSESITSSASSDSSSSEEPAHEQTTIEAALDALSYGFTLKARLNVTLTYYTSSNYSTIDPELPDGDKEAYYIEFIYQNSPTFNGVDQRYYEITKENGVESNTYLFGQNAFNFGGYVGMFYLEYNNTKQAVLAEDEDGELVTYGTSGLINPFLITQSNDFTETASDTYSLSRTKASIFYTYFFGVTDGYEQNVAFSTRDLIFEGSTLKSGHFVSADFLSASADTVPTETNSIHTAWVKKNFDISFEISDIGTSNSYDAIQPEPIKEENDALAQAFYNMGNASEITYTSLVGDPETGYGTYLNVYLMGETDGIYSQPYTVDEETVAPTSATESDIILRSRSSGGLMQVYQLNTNTNQFVVNGSNYSNLHGVYTYDEIAYYSYSKLADVSADIFNYNEEGDYYEPTADNIPYVVGDLFTSPLDYLPATNGYIEGVRIYLNDTTVESEIIIEHVEADYSYGGMEGTYHIYFSQLNDSHPSFDYTIIQEEKQ